MAAPVVSPPSYEDSQKAPGGPAPGTGPSYPQAYSQRPPQAYNSPHQGVVQPYGIPPQSYAIPAQPQVQYIVATGLPTATTVVSAPKASFPGPHTFYVYTLLVGIICTIIHPPSLIFAIPTFVLATLSVSKKGLRQYPDAAKLANYALALATITLIFTALAWLIYIGLIIGVADRSTRARCLSIRYDSVSGYRCSS